jgi:hypothetical protein
MMNTKQYRGNSLIGHWIDKATLSELDHRYRVFVEALPPRLVQLAGTQTLQSDSPPWPLQTVAELGPMAVGPWVFRDTFPTLTEKQLLDLSESWIFIVSTMILQDDLADGQSPIGLDTVEVQRQLMDKAGDILRSLMGDHYAFWQRFEQYKQQVKSALQLEVHYRASPQAIYDLATAWHIGAGKAALFKAIPWAMVVLSNDPSHFARLEASIDSVVAGRQLVDDAADWRGDLERGHVTYPLAQAISRLRDLNTEVSPKAIEALFLDSTILRDLLTQAKTWYCQALDAIDGIPCQGWIDFVNFLIEESTWYHRWLIIYQIAKAAGERDII